MIQLTSVQLAEITLFINHLTLIGKSWKTHPEIFLKFSFSGSSHRPFYWKTHPLKIMSTIQFFFNSGASHRPFYWKNHSDQILHIIYGFSQKIQMDELSSKEICIINMLEEHVCPCGGSNAGGAKMSIIGLGPD